MSYAIATLNSALTVFGGALSIAGRVCKTRMVGVGLIATLVSRIPVATSTRGLLARKALPAIPEDGLQNAGSAGRVRCAMEPFGGSMVHVNRSASRALCVTKPDEAIAQSPSYVVPFMVVFQDRVVTFTSGFVTAFPATDRVAVTVVLKRVMGCAHSTGGVSGITATNTHDPEGDRSRVSCPGDTNGMEDMFTLKPVVLVPSASNWTVYAKTHGSLEFTLRTPQSLVAVTRISV
jgi:hypothetical protein